MRKRRDVTFYRLHFTPKAAAVAEAEAGVGSRESGIGNCVEVGGGWMGSKGSGE